MEASEKGHIETVEVLIKGGANIDLTDEVGPLFHCCCIMFIR